MEVKVISVIGAGTMGNGIAHVFAQNNFKVYLIDTNKDILNKALKTIEANLNRQIKKEIINADQKQSILNNILVLDSFNDQIKDTDLYIEAIYENKGAKLSIYNKILNLAKDDSIIATNTSSISITELSRVNNPERFIGMHFMNPVPVMPLVEIIRGYSTSNDTFTLIRDLTLKINKVPVEVYDFPGFVSNRILMPMINEAIFTLMEGVAKAEDIDNVMKLGMSHPMGPLALADFIGLDVCLAIMEVLFNGFNDSKYRPCPLLKKMVAAGKLGKKSGEGFFKYS